MDSQNVGDIVDTKRAAVFGAALFVIGELGDYFRVKREAKLNISGSNFDQPSAHISPNGGSS